MHDGRATMTARRGGRGEFGLGLGAFARGFVKKSRGELGVKIEVLAEELGEHDEAYESRVPI